MYMYNWCWKTVSTKHTSTLPVDANVTISYTCIGKNW